jgi:hypothetical protein
LNGAYLLELSDGMRDNARRRQTESGRLIRSADWFSRRRVTLRTCQPGGSDIRKHSTQVGKPWGLAEYVIDIFRHLIDVTVELRGLPSPFGYLAFETISYSVPELIDTRPFEQVPFQSSSKLEAVDFETVRDHQKARLRKNFSESA